MKPLKWPKYIERLPAAPGIYIQKWKNGRFYIGKSKNIKQRAKQYVNYHHNKHARRLTKKYGRPKMQVLALANSAKHLIELENHYINLFFEDPQNINFCRAKEYKCNDVELTLQKERSRLVIVATNCMRYEPVEFVGWHHLKTMLGITYSGKIQRSMMLFDYNRKALKKQYVDYQKALINQRWFIFESQAFETCREAYDYSMIPVTFAYYQRYTFESYKEWLKHRKKPVVYDGLKFLGYNHAYLWAVQCGVDCCYEVFLHKVKKLGATSNAEVEDMIGALGTSRKS